MADALKTQKGKLTDAERLDSLWKWMKRCKKAMNVMQDRMRMKEPADDSDNSDDN